MVYIGCSGYYYSSWRPGFYPKELPASKWFGYYCEHFNTLELNNTFYKFPTLASLQKLYHASPPGFVFSLKVPQLITHYKNFINCSDPLTDFYMSVHEGMKEKVGPILFQLPARFVFTEKRLDDLVAALNPAFTNVVEFRDRSWWEPAVLKQLRKYDVHVCGVSHPSLPGDIMGDETITYYRFHGVPKLYLSSYSNPALKKIAEQVKECKSRQVFIYFNNTITLAGAENAKTIRKMIAAKQKA